MNAPMGFHELKRSLHEDIFVADHAPRTATALFERTRKEMIAAGGRCWICNKAHTHEDPLELHHSHIERCFMGEVDFGLHSNMRRDFPDFDWSNFDLSDPVAFVDDARANGLLLCKLHHTGPLGIHTLTFPDFEVQRYMKEGTPIMEGHVAHFYLD